MKSKSNKDWRVFLVAVIGIQFLVPVINAQTSSFTGKPMYQITAKRLGNVIGNVTIELFPNIAPKHVRNFDSLVGKNFYDSTAFHRVIPGFVIQGGDPNSRHGPKSTWGYGDPNQPTVNAEFSSAKHLRGILSAARSTNINSANSQFFICVATASSLDGLYSVYGKVVTGMNIVDSIVNSPRDLNDNPLLKIEMFVAKIGSNDTVPNAPVLTAPNNGTVGISTGPVALKWNSINDAIVYNVEVSTDSLFNNIFKSAQVGINSYVVTGMALATVYYWRVKANNGGKFSVFSPTWRYTTVNPLNIKVVNGDEKEIMIYPNPNNGVFTINKLEPNSVVQIYGDGGKLIYKIEANSETLSINMSEFPKGIYYCDISSSSQIKRGKIVFE